MRQNRYCAKDFSNEITARSPLAARLEYSNRWINVRDASVRRPPRSVQIENPHGADWRTANRSITID